MIWVRSVRSAPLRVLLAALVMLAGLAGARMQGLMGAQAALASSIGGGILCSGNIRPASGDESPAISQDHCLSCNLPVAVDTVPVVVARPVAYLIVERADVPARPAAATVSLSYRSRAPPPRI